MSDWDNCFLLLWVPGITHEKGSKQNISGSINVVIISPMP